MNIYNIYKLFKWVLEFFIMIPMWGSIGFGLPCGPCWEYKILSNLELPEKALGPLPLLHTRVECFFFNFLILHQKW
jgi:hypothetical protein